PVENPFASAALVAANTGLVPVVLLDNVPRLAGIGVEGWSEHPNGALDSSPSQRRGAQWLFEALNEQSERGVAFVLCGWERPLTEMIPGDEDVLAQIEAVRVERLDDSAIEKTIKAASELLGVEVSDSTSELMVQQLGGDLFYIRSVLDRAAADKTSLRSFVEFERVYAAEVWNGRIAKHLGGLLRVAAASPYQRRCALEILRLLSEADGALPLDVVIERAGRYQPDPEALLKRLHWMELLESSYSFVAPASDAVVCDYVRATYREEIVGSRPAHAGEELLR